jgi:hypothetical protein
VASVAYYARTEIIADAQGLTYHGLTRTLRFGYDDIQRVQVVPGIVTLYVVTARAQSFYFSSFFTRHRELAVLVRDRARLTG